LIKNDVLCLFSPLKDRQLAIKDSLLAGNYRNLLSREPLHIRESEVLYTYTSASRDFTGLHQTISLYPQDSVYQEQWVLTLMMPKKNLDQIVSSQNRHIVVLLIILAAFSVAVSLGVSRLYIKPVVSALELLKSDEITKVPKTKIPEIDDLIKFLAEQDTVADLGSDLAGEIENSPLFAEFVKNIDTLSSAERAVFNLYLKGYTAKEIADILCLSINTIKTHNKRIYMKLNVSSRKELMLYFHMLEEQKRIKPSSGK